MRIELDPVPRLSPDKRPGVGPLAAPATPDKRPLRQQVFECVRGAGHIARADITRALGVSPGSVTQLTAELIAAGLLSEVEARPRESGRGRPPVALEVVAPARHVIGMKLAETRHTGVLCDLAGNVLAEAAVPGTDRRQSSAALAAEAEALVAALLTRSGLRREAIAAYGVGLPGIVDYEAGIVRWSPLVEGRDAPMAALLSARLGAPAHVDNDANLYTLAELWFGIGRDIPDFAVVTIEQGVGMGLVLNSRLFRGGKGQGMELGHTKVQLDGALCRCGQRGCLEAYLADYALAREAATALGRGPDAAVSAASLFATLSEQARDGHEPARAIFRRAGRYLALGLANVIQLFDPNLIILSAERLDYGFLYTEEVLAEMQALTLSDGSQPTRVEIHAWGSPVWARGAAALALSALTDALFGEAWAA